MTTTPASSQAEQASDERALYQAWVERDAFNIGRGTMSDWYAWDAWQARAALASRAEAQPVAWLHEVRVMNGEPGETDQALSFHPDSYPLQSCGLFESIAAVPLYTAQPAPVSGAPSDDVLMLKREIHNLKRHIEDYCAAPAAEVVVRPDFTKHQPRAYIDLVTGRRWKECIVCGKKDSLAINGECLAAMPSPQAPAPTGEPK